MIPLKDYKEVDREESFKPKHDEMIVLHFFKHRRPDICNTCRTGKKLTDFVWVISTDNDLNKAK